MYWQQSIGSWKRFLTGFLSVSPVPLWTSSLHWWSFRKLFITELAAEHTVMSDDLVLLLLLFLTRIARPSIHPAALLVRPLKGTHLQLMLTCIQSCPLATFFYHLQSETIIPSVNQWPMVVYTALLVKFWYWVCSNIQTILWMSISCLFNSGDGSSLHLEKFGALWFAWFDRRCLHRYNKLHDGSFWW